MIQNTTMTQSKTYPNIYYRLSDQGKDTMIPDTIPEHKLEVVMSENEMTEIILTEPNQVENIMSDDHNDLDETVEDLESQYQSDLDHIETGNILPSDVVPTNGVFLNETSMFNNEVDSSINIHKSEIQSDIDITPSEQEHVRTYVSNLLHNSFITRKSSIRVKFIFNIIFR
jgi:hypothetical protein